MTRIIRLGLLGKIFSIHLGQTIFWGSASFSEYLLVIWAFTKAPIALVASLRETSILFALIMGIYFLQERVTLLKLVAILLAACGIVYLRLESS
ncbi:EamA family transporter [Thermodesulfobacteriota bacterium]